MGSPLPSVIIMMTRFDEHEEMSARARKSQAQNVRGKSSHVVSVFSHHFILFHSFLGEVCVCICWRKNAEKKMKRIHLHFR